MRRDLARDARVAPRALDKPHTVFRYTSRDKALRELREGIAPGKHMTARGSAERPLGAAAAQRRYGLPESPQVRETIQLPRGQKIRSAKALGGARGVGEMTSTEPVAAGQIKRVVRTP